MPEATRPDRVFGCFLHSTPFACNLQEHCSIKAALCWYIAMMYDRTM